MKSKKKTGLFNTEHAMDVVLIVIGIFLAIFTSLMIVIFCFFQSTPDTLIGCVFAATASECGIMGWIKNNKEKQETRKWELEDRKLQKIQNNIEGMVDNDE